MSEKIEIPDNGTKNKSLFSRMMPILVVIALIGCFFAFDLDHYFSFESLKENRSFLINYQANNAILAVLIYIALYATCTALSLPIAAFVTVFGGFIFGSILGTLWTVIGATIGASIIFLIARYALADLFRGRTGGLIEKMKEGFTNNALNYLLLLRLVPLFPFFAVNIVPAFLKVSLSTFIIATFIGIIPGTFVFSQIGAGLGSILDSGEDFTTKGVITPDIFVALVGLGVLSLVPVVYKKFAKK